MSISDIILILIYFGCAFFTAWIASVILEAELLTHPKTRHLNISWLGVIAGIIIGFLWPIMIPVFIIWAGLIK